MLFFRTISLVAALAFATLSSAVPFDGAGLVTSGDVFARDVSELTFPVKRGGSFPQLYSDCRQNVLVIIVDINVAVKAGNYDDIPGYLDNIVDEINYLISGVEEYGIVDLDITVEAFADIVVGLVQIIVDVLLVVANISAQITASINVIGGLLGSLLHLTLNVVVGLNVNILSSLLQPLAEDLDSLGILDIFVNIGISISISL